jgi:hypothetical protein
MKFPFPQILACGLACMPGPAALPAAETAATLRIAHVAAREGTRKEMVYYIWDGGDGRWLPTAIGFAEAVASAAIPWILEGEPKPRWRAVGLSGWTSDWKPCGRTRVEPSTAPLAPQLPVKSASAQALGKSKEVKTGAKGELSWNGLRLAADFTPSSLTLDLGGVRGVDWLILRGDPRNQEAGFPQHFLIQSAVSPDGPWYPVVSANYAFFPDPEANEVWIPLRGLLARALRVHVPRPNALAGGGFGWTLGGIRLLGGAAPAFQADFPAPESLAAWNNLWLNFGIAGNEIHQRFDPWWETDRPSDGGMVCIGSCEWLAWGAKKLSWLGDGPFTKQLEKYIAGNPVDPDGMVWAAPNSAEHLDHSVHHVNNSIYPTAVAHHFLMRRDPAFLETKDPESGETILAKARKAMDYNLEKLGGKSGMLTLPGRDLDGTPGSHGSNYWDFWLFGYKCAHTNAFFHEALRQFAELEEALGNTGRAAELRALRPKVKEEFNRAFWNEQTGRYAGWIDANGKAHDFGFTFVNTQALAFGLADETRAARVLDWLDGKRAVAGDDSTGADIYAFGFAPRANTREARRGNPPVVNTWDGAFDIEPGGNAAYGLQIQNGGAIFYVSYYDLHGRMRYAGADDAAKRFSAIEAEFRKDQLRRDPANNKGVSDIFGILREFPESGLVPYFFVDGILGIEPAAAGLRIAPALPEAIPSATVTRLAFAGKTWSITAARDAKRPVADGATIRLPATGAWLLTPDGKIAAHE